MGEHLSMLSHVFFLFEKDCTHEIFRMFKTLGNNSIMIKVQINDNKEN